MHGQCSVMADTTCQLSEVCEIKSDEERIEQSKSHWTLHPEPDDTDSHNAGKSKHTGGVSQRGRQPNESSARSSSACCCCCCCGLLRRVLRRRRRCRDSNISEEEGVEPCNDEEVFEALQRNPEWGEFFHRFRQCELVMAEKPFAEGGQAEVYAAQIKWYNSSPSEEELNKDPWKWVLKVFKKKGQPLQALQKQWPQGMLQFQKERCHFGAVRRYTCDVVCGTLLQDGRFAFLMQREKEDLRHCIERNMKWSPRKAWRNSRQFGPFSQEVGERLMYEIALGMKWLHDRGILHRDLKSSNVLLSKDGDQTCCFVADFECSEGVEGTHFWRAPEILKAIKSKVKFEERRKLFTKASDVYSYGMTCYEILTGKVPFEGHNISNYDVVLKGQFKLEVPNYVAKWLHELLSSCWQFDPKQRPTFEKILEVFEKHGRSCATRDIPHSKYGWSQLILTIRMSMLTELEEFRSTRESIEHFRTALSSEISFDIEWSDHDFGIEWSDYDSEEGVGVDNMEVFQFLQRDPKWGSFFCTFGYDTEVFLSSGSLEIGEKFGEGAQGDIFKVHVRWVSEETNEYDQRNNREWVLKVYKEGTSLDSLRRQWPTGLFSYHAERVESTKRGYGLKPRNVCDVVCGMLLEDGRFAHLLERHQGDLRQLIDFNMKLRSGYDCGPFSKEVAEGIIFEVALGMDWMHSYDIVLRDLKASNVLVKYGDRDGEYQCFVCDYESSIGVLGTGFWRAPEILEAIKERRVGASREKLFTKAIDVYGFGMTCFEILTGGIPFKNLDSMNFDVVLSGGRPEVPKYVDNWAHELLNLCWQADPATRPSFQKILDLILANSVAARRLNEIRRDEIEAGYYPLPMKNDDIFLRKSFLGRILGEA